MPPTAMLSPGNRRIVDEGPAQHTYTFSVSDPGQDTVAGIVASCGTGGRLVAGSETASSFACVFPDGPATSTVSVRATDSDGDTGPADTEEVTVHNVPPTATLDEANDVVVRTGAPHTFAFTVTDPGDDTVSAIDATRGAGGALVDGSVTASRLRVRVQRGRRRDDRGPRHRTPTATRARPTPRTSSSTASPATAGCPS